MYEELYAVIFFYRVAIGKCVIIRVFIIKVNGQNAPRSPAYCSNTTTDNNNSSDYPNLVLGSRPSSICILQ